MKEESETPDMYVDQMRLSTGVFGVSITFGLSEPHPAPGGRRESDDKVCIRMSLEHAKITAMMLRKQLLGYERSTGTKIEIPANVYTGLGLAAEDW